MNPAVQAAAAANAASGHRKSYDWLIPSTAGASHHGPEGRDEQLKKQLRISGWQPDDTSEPDGDMFANLEKSSPAGGPSGSASKAAKSAEAKAAALEARRRSHKRRKEGEPPGPGKNWRKGKGK